MSFAYLATPYSKYKDGMAQAYVDACLAAAHLVKQGRGVFSPIAHTHGIAEFGNIDKLDHDIWLPADQPMMDAASSLVVVKMPGWDESYGVGVEIETFKRAGKPIEYMEWPIPKWHPKVGEAS